MPLLIALVATGFWGLQLQSRLSSQNSQLTELQSELANFGSGRHPIRFRPVTTHRRRRARSSLALMAGPACSRSTSIAKSAGAYELLVNQDGKLVPAAEFTVGQDGKGQARFQLDQPFADYESVHIRAKALDPGQSETQSDTLVRDSDGALGSTGSGLEVTP